MTTVSTSICVCVCVWVMNTVEFLRSLNPRRRQQQHLSLTSEENSREGTLMGEREKVRNRISGVFARVLCVCYT